MPAVKLLHQHSESNTKPEYIMGHSLQAVSPLVTAAQSVFAVPLAVRIHEGLVWSNRDRRTLLDKMLSLLAIVAIEDRCYFVTDAFYAARKIFRGLLKHNNHLVTRVRSNAVAYTGYRQRGPKQRGRPRLYGEKVKLSSLVHAADRSDGRKCSKISCAALTVKLTVNYLGWDERPRENTGLSEPLMIEVE